jgi:hypothetical protein
MMDLISLVRKLIMIRRNPKETSLKEGAILTKYALTQSMLVASLKLFF